MRRAISILLCWLCCGHVYAQQHNQLHIEKLNHAYTYLRNNYVDEVDVEPLVEAALEATLKELDPHSSYLPREEFLDMYNGINGEYSGVGFSMTTLRDTLVVMRTLDGSPSERAGVKKNDRVVSVNGTSLIGVEYREAVELLRGKKGSVASLSILRGGKELTIDVVRDDIPTNAIGTAFMLDGNIAYVRVDSFLSKTTTEEFCDAIKALKAKPNAIIVDLRGNIGGLLPSAIQFSELFLQRGDVIVTVEGRSKTTTYQASKRGIYADIPVVVLTDEETASASEIVAGALQDHDRAVIVGRRSFGKGLVQRLIKFKDESGMKITIARYKTPSGRIIQRPYTNGEHEEYIADQERYQRRDTANIPDSLIFSTLNLKRKVYGGGGISPDIYIDRDTTPLRPFTRTVLEQGIAEQVIIAYFDRVDVDEFMVNHPTLEAYSERFTLDAASVELMEHLVTDVNPDAANDTTGMSECIAIVEAQMAEELYDAGSRYKLYGRHHDLVFKRAVEIINDKMFQKSILSPISRQTE